MKQILHFLERLSRHNEREGFTALTGQVLDGIRRFDDRIGLRAYEYARSRCSRGTYIRSLARDLGLALGSGAYLTALRRTASGSFFLPD